MSLITEKTHYFTITVHPSVFWNYKFGNRGAPSPYNISAPNP